MAARALAALVVAIMVVFPRVHAQGWQQQQQRQPPQLSFGYYQQRCPQAVGIIRNMVGRAIDRDQRMGASLLRLHFHDCFVTGCDASILLDGGNSEKNTTPNESVRGYELIDQIKSALNDACRGNVVSCADITAVAARDSVAWLGGPVYQLPLGRLDSRTADAAATSSLPRPDMDLQGLLQNFRDRNLDLKDLVALSGGHTVGFARCGQLKTRFQSADDINARFADSVRQRCRAPSWVESLLFPFDRSPNSFDNSYFRSLVNRRGLLKSDQALFRGDGSESDKLVQLYSTDRDAFFRDFGNAMVKMGNLSPRTGVPLEIRTNCRVPNN